MLTLPPTFLFQSGAGGDITMIRAAVARKWNGSLGAASRQIPDRHPFKMQIHALSPPPAIVVLYLYRVLPITFT